jgi:hypothetical protein
MLGSEREMQTLIIRGNEELPVPLTVVTYKSSQETAVLCDETRAYVVVVAAAAAAAAAVVVAQIIA